MKKSLLVLFGIIFVIAALLRIVNLSNDPPSLHADEIDTGYTAYSIIKTLHDPFGNFLPVQFIDQGKNYRAPIYTYLTVPSVEIFGLNPFAERFPSALLGMATIFLMFFLVKKLLKNDAVSIIAAGLMAINPWAIHISRTGLEVMPLLFFVVLGVDLFLYTDKKHWYFLIFSAIAFGLSTFTYHPGKVFIPVFLPLLLLFRKDLFANYKKELGIFLIIVITFYLSMLKVSSVAEYSNVTVFNPTNASINVNRERHLTNAPLWLSGVFHNKILYYIKQFENSYFGVFTVNYFFLNGEGNLDKGVSNHGEFYLFELPFFFLGLYFIAKKNKKNLSFLIGWMLIGAIPAGITTTGYYSYRDVLLLPIPIIFSSYGFISAFELAKKYLPKKVLLLSIGALSFVCLMFISSYLFTYFFDYPVYSASWWQYPQEQAFSYIDNNNHYQKIYIYGGVDWAERYAFRKHIDPHTFQEAYLHPKLIDNMSFIKLNNLYFGLYLSNKDQQIPKDFQSKNTLYEVPGNFLKNSSYKFTKFTDEDGLNIIMKFTTL